MKADFENDSRLAPLALKLPFTLCICFNRRSISAVIQGWGDVTSPSNSGPVEKSLVKRQQTVCEYYLVINRLKF